MIPSRLIFASSVLYLDRAWYIYRAGVAAVSYWSRISLVLVFLASIIRVLHQYPIAAVCTVLAFLATGLVTLAVSVWRPELPYPLGGPEVIPVLFIATALVLQYGVALVLQYGVAV